jgi:hypothetical protein
MFPHDFIFGVVISLNLVEPSSLVARDSVLLVENPYKLFTKLPLALLVF